jgi:hypothetical protein
MVFAQVTVGSDTYGKTQVVDGTPIVTKFAMVSFLPVWPLQSIYFAGLGKQTGTMIPFVVGSTSQQIIGIPMARLHTQSVCLAVARGIAGAMITIGLPWALMGVVNYSTGERMDAGAKLAIAVLSVLAVVGAAGGAATYLIGRWVDPHSRAIRSACGRVLGIAADPALAKVDVADAIKQAVDAGLAARGVPNPDAAVWARTTMPREILDLLIVRARAKLAGGNASPADDPVTKQLLALHGL